MLKFNHWYVGITSLTRLFSFNIYHSKSYFDLNLCKYSWFTTMHKMTMLFFIWNSYQQGPKKGLFHIWPYHLYYRSQWPQIRARHIVFQRHISWPTLINLDQIIFKLRVGHEFAKFGHNFLLKGHSDLILKWDTPST